ncbi:MAG: SMC-Scp complex subunit ScpB [bacterium]
MDSKLQKKSNNKIAALEAILFMHGDAISFKRLMTLLSCDREMLEESLRIYAEMLEDVNRGITLLIRDEQVLLMTKPSLGHITREIAREEFDAPLTPASLETLSIIAYIGPCTRARVDYIRGVNSSSILRNLTVRGLVEKKKDTDNVQTFLYQVTNDFLRYIGVSNCDTLPAYSEYKEEMQRLFLDEEKVVDHEEKEVEEKFNI